MKTIATSLSILAAATVDPLRRHSNHHRVLGINGDQGETDLTGISEDLGGGNNAITSTSAYF